MGTFFAACSLGDSTRDFYRDWSLYEYGCHPLDVFFRLARDVEALGLERNLLVEGAELPGVSMRTLQKSSKFPREAPLLFQCLLRLKGCAASSWEKLYWRRKSLPSFEVSCQGPNWTDLLCMFALRHKFYAAHILWFLVVIAFFAPADLILWSLKYVHLLFASSMQEPYWLFLLGRFYDFCTIWNTKSTSAFSD